MGACYWQPAQKGFKCVDKNGQPGVMSGDDAAALGLVSLWPAELKIHETECRK